MGPGLNLSTILEKSDMIENSNMSIALTPSGMKKKCQISISKSSDLTILDQEFVYDSVADKMKCLSKIMPQPSRLQHKSNQPQMQKLLKQINHNFSMLILVILFNNNLNQLCQQIIDLF
ncbi:unnamed protein product (macronuclear) [Paramecium tetraurelia]|uniref:Uncharacterized protein n=1 Tax=Paramecium tetraurelia TaxID=5888 RepID=A0EC72_PARTE|nr:uncharacterized protein GSPATT00025625001 [Paramecium tetraurelia]CAK92889.1 unnamed protein product [Paramecium tetraurelia]|eukprot:XP_001460286.1 hypothetical protein (macronuclear) [Paramecium tetraurelia strain d4-2]